MKRRICIFIVLTMCFCLISSCKTVKTVSVKDNNISAVSENNEIPDTVRLAVLNAENLNPYTQNESLNLKSLSLIFEPLFAYDENMHIVPVLAESYEIKDGGKTVTVTVKDGILWHDGKTLSANDVLYTINLILTSDTLYSKGIISRAEMKNSKTVEISFFKPQMSPLQALMFPIVKSKTSEVGTGPFKCMGKESSDTYALLRFEEYHSEKSDISEVKIINCPEYNAVKRLFEIGETDILTSDAFDYASFNQSSGIKVYDYPKNEFLYLGINFENSMFWGESTRQALLYILDKEKNVQKSLYKKAVPVDFPINPDSYLYPKTLEYEKDSQKAEELLLKDSWTRVDGVFARMIDGVKQNFNIRLLVMDNEEMRGFCESIEKSLDNFGIECTVTALPEAEYILGINNKEYDIFLGKEELFASSDFEKLTGEGNIFGYLNSDLNALVDEIRLENNQEKLSGLYYECCEIFLSDVQFIPLFFYKDALAVRGNIPVEFLPLGVERSGYNYEKYN